MLSESEQTTCAMCSSTSLKYKCLNCRLASCSMVCSNAHREHCDAVPVVQSNNGTTNNVDTATISEDTVKSLQLDHLQDSTSLKQMLSHRELRRLLFEIDSSDQPGRILKSAMDNHEFEHFAKICLQVIEPVPLVERTMANMRDPAIIELLQDHLLHAQPDDSIY